MEKRTCAQPDCDRPLCARGLCRKHYEVAWKTGALPEEWESPRQRDSIHALSNIDRERLIADCRLCGPGVAIGIRTSRQVPRCIKGAAEGRARTRDPERTRQWRRGLSKEARRAEHLRGKYRLTLEQYNRMYQAVDGKCEICGTPEDLLRVDHDHFTGVVRGLLCHRCNVGIGWLNDSAQRAASAAKYLRRSTGLIF